MSIHKKRFACVLAITLTGLTACKRPRPTHSEQATVEPAAVEQAAVEKATNPDRCLEGFVFRDAVVGDRVCVTPAARAQALDDNAQAMDRIQPGGGPYGPYTCRQGFVWRESMPGDLVCVTPDIRSQTAADNAQAGARRAQPSL
jgi:hypothetical protein